MVKKKVYIVEDDQNIRDLLVYKIDSAGFDVMAYETGELGLHAILADHPDIILLDLMLPGIDGYEICRRVRENDETQNAFILMLTARGEEGDRILGLEIGADDYIVKPFSTREIVARVRSASRRIDRTQNKNTNEVIQIGDLKLIPKKREAYKNNELVDLKVKEYDLLYYLMLNAGIVLSRDKLLNDIWGYDYGGETRTVDVHISQLRFKIEDNPETPKYIKTLRSVGYKFNEFK